MLRRDFIRTSAFFGIASSFFSNPRYLPYDRLHINMYSRHLQFLEYGAMAEVVKDMGFDGVDLTVRPGGHVEPQQVNTKLAEALGAIRERGLSAESITTNVLDSTDPIGIGVLEEASKQGVKLYRMGYLKFPEGYSVDGGITFLNGEIKRLVLLNERLGLAAAFHNHASNDVRAAIWDIWHLLENTNPRYIGCQYDIRHATVEGAVSWKTGLRLISSRINSIVLKDFVWEKKEGRWTIKNVPLGQGMVDFPAFFRELKEYKINVPVTIHCEYDLGGAERGARTLEGITADEVYSAIQKDLEYARKTWEES